MCWVTGRIEEERKTRDAMPAPQPPYSPQPPWLPVWEEIISATQAFVREFNQEQRAEQFRVSWWPTKGVHMEVVSLPAGHRVATLVLQVTDERIGELGLVCPPEGQGIGRHANFRMSDGKIEALPNFVGMPRPSSGAMTADEFVHFILEPLLFPNRR